MVVIKFWIETKKYVLGNGESIDCQLLAREDYYAILKHTLTTELQLGNYSVASETVTYRFHWPNRSYNLVKFCDANGMLIANYFNMVDSVVITENEVLWRDLNTGVLVMPNGETQLIAGHNRPPLSETWLHIFIAASTQDLLRKYQVIIAETDQLLQKCLATQVN